MGKVSRWGWLALVLLMTGVVAESRQAPTLPEIMRQKLDHTQQILAGVATAQFGTIERNANDLRILADLSSWNVMRTPEYLRFSNDFKDTARRLSQAALDRNLDAATLAYVELTLKCVECHKYVRGVENARDHYSLPRPDPLAND